MAQPAAVSPYVGAARAALGQGLAMGWGDEAEAWMRSRLGQGTYEENLARIRDEYARYSKENPFVSGALEFAGGAAPGVAAMFIPGGQAAGAAQLQRSTLGALGRLAAVGGVSGAVSGAGSAEEGNRLQGAGVGAIIGAGVGGAAPVAIRSGKGIYNYARERLAPTPATIERSAAQKFTRAMQEGEIDPSDIEAMLRADRSMGVPSVVANANPALADLAEAVAQRTGRGARKVEETLNRQKAGARERTYQQTVKGLKPGDYYRDEADMVQALRSRARTMYDQAYDVGEVLNPKIQLILDTPELKSAYDTARKIAAAEASVAKIRGEDPSKYALREVYDFTRDAQGNLTGITTKEIPDVRTLDYMKRALDAKISAGYASDDAAVRASTSALKDIRNELRDTLKAAVPEYQQALAKYAGDSEVIDAMRRGYAEFGKMDHEQVIKLVAGMTASEKEAFRTGVARDLYSRVMTPSGNFNAAQRLIGSPEMQAKLQPLFDNAAEFELFRNALKRESELFYTANRVLGGSQTGKRMQMREALEEGPGVGEALAQAVTGGFWSSLSSLAARAISSGAFTEKTASRLADMLMSKDPAEVAAVVRALERHAQEAAPRAVKASATEAGAVTGTAAAIHPAPSVQTAPPDIETDSSAEPSGQDAVADIEADIEAERKKSR